MLGHTCLQVRSRRLPTRTLRLADTKSGPAGSYGRTVLDDGQGELALEWWQVAAAVAFTVGALGYLAKIAKSALDEAELELE